MQDVIWNGRPTLRKPVMVCAFNGWNDAGEAASAAVAFIRGSFDAEEVASIDPEEFFDFTAVRPTVRLTRGGHARDRLAGGRDLCRGRARRRGRPGDAPGHRAVAALAALHGQPGRDRPRARRAHGDHAGRAARRRAPHPAGRRSPASPPTRSLVDRLGFQHTSYEGPTGIVGVLHNTLRATRASRRRACGRRCPHYVAAAPNPKVALALVRAFEGIAGVVVDAGELESAVRITNTIRPRPAPMR